MSFCLLSNAVYSHRCIIIFLCVILIYILFNIFAKFSNKCLLRYVVSTRFFTFWEKAEHKLLNVNVIIKAKDTHTTLFTAKLVIPNLNLLFNAHLWGLVYIRTFHLWQFLWYLFKAWNLIHKKIDHKRKLNKYKIEFQRSCFSFHFLTHCLVHINPIISSRHIFA